MEDNVMYIPSVNEAAKKIISCYNAENFEELKAVGEYLENNDVARSIAGNGNEFHNATVHLTQYGFYDYAYALAKVGVNRYSCNTDLLGDLLLYGLQCKSLDELQQWHSELGKINKRFWTWRAYQFLFDYWMERLPYAENDEILHSWENIIESLFEAFKNNFQYITDKSDCEKAYIMEFEYYDSKGDEDSALAALKKATEDKRTANKCAQCALKLADRYFEMGNYEDSFTYANIAVGIKQAQNSIDKGYAYYILAMSQEWREKNNHSLAANIQQVFNNYFAAYIYLEPKMIELLGSIKKQVKQLEYEYNKSSNIPFDELDSEKSSRIDSFLKMLGM